MPREYSADTLDALAQDAVLIDHLVEFELDEPTGTIRLTDAFQNVEWGGNTYTAAGHFLTMGDVEETSTLTINTLQVNYSGVDQSMIALVLQEHYLDRTLRIRRAYFDPDTWQIRSVETLFEGRVNRPDVAEDPDNGTSTVAIDVSNMWVDFERSPGRTTNHEQQQLWFPGDRGFEYAARVFQDLPWGGKA